VSSRRSGALLDIPGPILLVTGWPVDGYNDGSNLVALVRGMLATESENEIYMS
jgi:hypothetical protein